MVSSHYCMGALLSSRLSSRRPEIINELKELGVGTSIYYPHPVPEMSYYRKACIGEVFLNARLISESMIALPVGPIFDQTDMTRISESLSNVLEKHLQITGKKITLIGGAGFIGHNLAIHLKNLGADVSIIDSLQVNNLASFSASSKDSVNRKLYLSILNERQKLLNNLEIPLHSRRPKLSRLQVVSLRI